MTGPDESRLEQIGQESDRLWESGKWNLSEFERLYAEAIEACRGDFRSLEMFNGYMPGQAYFEAAGRITAQKRLAPVK